MSSVFFGRKYFAILSVTRHYIEEITFSVREAFRDMYKLWFSCFILLKVAIPLRLVRSHCKIENEIEAFGHKKKYTCTFLLPF